MRRFFALLALCFLGLTPLCASEKTLVLIKPEAVAQGHVGHILSHYEARGWTIAALKKTRLSAQEASCFYSSLQGRPFFSALVRYMSSGPIVAAVIEGEDVVRKNRELMGATNPEFAEEGTLRALYGTNVQQNAVHGSDSPASAAQEIPLLFPDLK